jgi:PAS domain S-box-containing protein
MRQLATSYRRKGIALEKNRRILLVDDSEAIHQDFKKILSNDKAEADFESSAAELFGEVEGARRHNEFELDFAFQGREALERVRESVKAGRPYAMAFMDVRMPPGWDGLETTLRLWEVDPDIQIVICTAYSDYSWGEIGQMIVHPEQLLILKKPFDSIEVLQFAHALTEKWALLQAARHNTDELERTINERTWELKSTVAVLEAEMAGHRATEEKVRDQALLLEKGHDAIIVLGLDEVVTSWNAGAERLYGWEAGEVIGRKGLKAFLENGTKEKAMEGRKTVLQDGSWRGRLSQKTKDGRTVHVECHWTLARDDEGGPKSIIEINTDITEKNQLEAQFLRAQRVEGIGSLATGIAHDLNNLLAPILLSASLLKLKCCGAENKGLIEGIEVSAQHAVDVVKQVLYFAKGLESRQTDVKLAQLIGEFETMIRGTIPKSIEIKTSIPGDTWLVKADPTQMNQVLLNLCVNARDAMPTGGTIEIATENVQIDATYAASVWGLKAGRYVRIKVADTGSGIPPEVVDKIFEPFFTTKESEKGTGLGLSTAFGILKNHGGAITVRSEIGVGTTFYAYLPAVG